MHIRATSSNSHNERNDLHFHNKQTNKCNNQANIQLKLLENVTIYVYRLPCSNALRAHSEFTLRETSRENTRENTRETSRENTRENTRETSRENTRENSNNYHTYVEAFTQFLVVKKFSL